MIILHDETGFITHITSDPGNPESFENAMKPDNALEFPNDMSIDHWTHYVENPLEDKSKREILLMPSIDLPEFLEIKADGKDGFKLSGLLRPVKIRLDGEEIEIMDGKLEFSTKEPGTYVFESVFPYLPWHCEVTAK